MGYNLTKNSVIRNKPQLDQLREARKRGGSVLFPASRADKLASKLRESLRAAEKHEEYQHYYEELYNDYSFKETDRGVLAEFVGSREGVEIESTSLILSLETRENGKEDRPITPQENSFDPSCKSEFEDAHELFEVMAHAVMNEECMELSFPNVKMGEGDLNDLLNWSLNKGWKIVDSGERGLVLTKSADVPKEIVYKRREG